eukprot:365174-Chlamydomonas_euryale.AAC.6
MRALGRGRLQDLQRPVRAPRAVFAGGWPLPDTRCHQGEHCMAGRSGSWWQGVKGRPAGTQAVPWEL